MEIFKGDEKLFLVCHLSTAFRACPPKAGAKIMFEWI